MSTLERIERIKESGGWLERYQHDSASCRCRMTFSVYLPPQAEQSIGIEYFMALHLGAAY